MEELHVYRDETFPKLLALSLNEMRCSGTLCDVTLLCDGEIPAHRIILGAASPYFRGMFSLGLKESQEERIEINCMDGAVLRAIVDFVYTGEISVAENLVIPLLEASSLLQLGSLRSACMEILLRSATPFSSLEFDILAGRLGLVELESFLHRLTIENFDSVAFGNSKKRWLNAPCEAIRPLLNHFAINTLPADRVIKAAIEWILHDPTGSREIHVKSLLSGLNHLSETDISQDVRDLLDLRPDFCDKFLSLLEPCSRETQRCITTKEALVVFTVGGYSERSPLKNVECYLADSPASSGWNLYLPEVPELTSDSGSCQKAGVLDRVIPAMKFSRAYAASAYSDYEMFVIGGEHCWMPVTTEASVERYSIISNTWSVMPSLPLPKGQEKKYDSGGTRLLGAAAVLVEGDLYVCGGRLEQVNWSDEETVQPQSKKNQLGRILKEAWVYNRVNCKWRQCSDMQVARAYHGVATVGGVLYAIGGIGDPGAASGAPFPKCLDSVECFDPWDGIWRSLNVLPAPRAYFGCVSSRQNIYVMGGHDLVCCKDTVFKYNTMKDSWCYVERPLRTPVDSLSVASLKYRAKSMKNTPFHSYLIGGQNSYNGLRDFNAYNFITNRWRFLQPLIQERVGASAAILRLPVNFPVSP